MRTIESDVCIIGAGITGTLVAEKLTDEFLGDVLLVEQGKEHAFEDRFRDRERWLSHGESPFPGDFVTGDVASGSSVGGRAMHWTAVATRFSSEDFRMRSLYGIGSDWPISYGELEPSYCEAEARIGVAGEEHPADDPRSVPFPMPPEPLDYDLSRIAPWLQRAGVVARRSPFARNTRDYRGRPQCKRCDTCYCCPIGAKYTPDFTLRELRARGKVRLFSETTIRRLRTDDSGRRVIEATGVDQRTHEEVRFRARVFVLAGGTVWVPHLLLVSASPNFPNGLANRSGLVGHFLTGHLEHSAVFVLPERLFPGNREVTSLTAREFMRKSDARGPVRFDLTAFPVPSRDRAARLRDGKGQLLLRQQLLDNWRADLAAGLVNARFYVHALPARESRIALDADQRNEWGDPTPRLLPSIHEDSKRIFDDTNKQIDQMIARLEQAGARLRSRKWMTIDRQDDRRAVVERLRLGHQAGGCRMGTDPEGSVCDPSGRTHDHENLYIVGAPLSVTGGCTNGTLTFSANSLRVARKIGERFLRTVAR